MQAQRLARLGEAAFSQSIHPLKRTKRLRKARIIGFDTEYDSQTNELISVQLGMADGHAHFHEVVEGQQLTWAVLWDWCCSLLTDAGFSVAQNELSAVLLIAFFSLAEMQHLPWWDEHAYIREHSNTYEWSYPGTTKQSWLCPACWHQKVRRRKGLATCQSCGMEGPEEAFSYRRPLQVMRVIDLQTWFTGQSLGAVAKVFGEEKLTWQRDQVSRADLAKPGFLEYAIHDAVLCARIYSKLRDTFLTEWGVDIAETRTPAATSGAILRANYMSDPVIHNPHHRSRKLAILANWGGNNQAFARGVGEGLWFEYDAVSMYPSSAICLGVLPRADDICYLQRDEVFNPVFIGGWVHARFEFPEDEVYPCLPVYDGSRLIYPLAGETYCSIEEIRLAREYGARIDVIEAYGYAEGTDSLTRYLQDMIYRKEQADRAGDMVGRTLWKLMMNSVIGKFCQKVIKWDVNDLMRLQTFFHIPVQDLLRMDEASFLAHAREFETITGRTCRERVNVGSLWMPEWNTLILGYARATLARAFRETKAMIGTTDSLITSQDRGPGFTCNGIRFERKTWGTHLVIVRTRLYALWGGYCLSCHQPVEQETEGMYVCPRCSRPSGKPKIAYHAIHSSKAAQQILRTEFPSGAAYAQYRIPLRFIRLREALATGKALGAPVRDSPRIVSLEWDGKRVLKVPWWQKEQAAIYRICAEEVTRDLEWRRRIGYNEEYEGAEELLRREVTWRILQGRYGEQLKLKWLSLLAEEERHGFFDTEPLKEVIHNGTGAEGSNRRIR